MQGWGYFGIPKELELRKLQEKPKKEKGGPSSEGSKLPSKGKFFAMYAGLTPGVIKINPVRPFQNLNNFYECLEYLGLVHKELDPGLLFNKLKFYLDPVQRYNFPPNKKTLVRVSKLLRDLHWFHDHVPNDHGFGGSQFKSVPQRVILKTAIEIVDWEKSQLVRRTQSGKRGREKDVIAAESLYEAIHYLVNDVRLKPENAYTTLADLTCAWDGRETVVKEITRLRKIVRSATPPKNAASSSNKKIRKPKTA